MSGRGRRGGDVHEGLPAGVGEVDGDAVALHLPHHHPSELAETGVVAFEASGAEQVLLVVGELADAQAELFPQQQRFRAGADEGGVLREQDVRELALGLGAADGVGRVGETERRLVVDDLEELLDARERLGGVLVGHRDGQADGGEAGAIGAIGAAQQVLHARVDDDGLAVEAGGARARRHAASAYATRRVEQPRPGVRPRPDPGCIVTATRVPPRGAGGIDVQPVQDRRTVAVRGPAGPGTSPRPVGRGQHHRTHRRRDRRRAARRGHHRDQPGQRRHLQSRRPTRPATTPSRRCWSAPTW